MSRNLIIEEVTQQGSRELGRLQSEDVIVGREPEPSGVAIPSKAVSRNHGVFTRIRSHWFYRDLGSTNGSWINGVQVAANDWKIVRPGTMMQLADAVIRISSSASEGGGRGQNVPDHSSVSGRSIIVFAGGEFLDEFPIPEYGKALVVGGAQGDLQLEGDIFEQPSLVVERRGDSIVAFGMVREVELLHNGRPVKETVKLSDGDTIGVGKYSVLLNDPSRSSALSEQEGLKTSVREWGGAPPASFDPEPASSRARAAKPFTTFGQAPTNEGSFAEETVALNQDEIEAGLQGADMHPSMRYNIRSSGVPSLNTFEDRLILGVGIFLSMVLMALVVWWVFF